MVYTPPKFGPKNGIDSKDYILWMAGLGGPTDEPINLFGHGLTSPSQNLADALNYVEVVLRNGRVQTVSRVKRAAFETSRTYTVGFPSALWTPLMDKFNCPLTLYLIYVCAEDRIYDHWDILPDAYMNPPIEAEDVITITEETNIVTQTAEITIPFKLRGWNLGFERIYDVTEGLHAVAWMTEDCAGCGFLPGFEILIGGGDGTAAGITVLTDDRFGSVSSLTDGGAVGDVIVSQFAEGDIIVQGYADTAVLATAATGAVRYSTNRGVTWAAASGTGTDILWDIVKLGNTLIGVGGDGTNGAIYISENNGATWTQIANAIVDSAGALFRAAVDKDLGRIYAVGEGAKFIVATLSGSSLLISDLEPNLPATAPTDLFSVAVLGQGYVVVGGTAGYLAQSKDSGATFVRPAFTGTGDVNGIAGNVHRMVVSAGSVLFQRNAMTKNQLRQITLENGQTLAGAVTRLIMGLDDNFNLFIGTTASGEVFIGKPFYPNA